MAAIDLKTLKARGLSVLRIGPEGWYDLEASRGAGARFTLVFPHTVARQAAVRAPVLIVLPGGRLGRSDYWFEDDRTRAPQLKLAWVRTIQAVATRQSRVSFDHVMPISPATLDELVGSIAPGRFKASAANLLNSTSELQELSPKFGEWVLDRIATFPDNEGALQRLTALVNKPKRFDGPLAMQEDALALALRTFGASGTAATRLDLTPRTTALATARAQENLVIEHDAKWIPGWRLADSDITGRAVFEDGEDRLEVFTANREDLERVFGVDLIYLNQRRRSIVMVQYKMLEPLPRKKRQVEGVFQPQTITEEREWIVVINDQFKKEIARMEAFDQPAGDVSAPYRMNPSPFFFKLVRRRGSTNGSGIMLSLGHLQQLHVAGALTGPRDGLRIAYSELQGHYLRSESFVELVRSGYIGSHSATTDAFQALIGGTLAGGRSVVAAIQHALPSIRATDAGWS